jgi:adenylate kinase
MSLFTDSRNAPSGSQPRRPSTPVDAYSTLSPQVDQNPCAIKRAGVLLIGAPGSGKGTIGKTLHRMDGFIHVSTGDLIRRASTQNSLGHDGHALMSHGGLITDTVLWNLFDSHLAERLSEESDGAQSQLLVLDGVPRTRDQADELSRRVDVRAVIYLECHNIDILYHRLQHRSMVEARVDDASRSVVYRRLRIFEEETLPVLEAYHRSIVHRIDATMRPAHVLTQVLDGLKLATSFD